VGISCPFEAAVCFSALFGADEAMEEAVPAAPLEVALLFFDSIRLERFRGCIMDASAEVTVADGGGAVAAAAAAGVAPDIRPLVLLLPV